VGREEGRIDDMPEINGWTNFYVIVGSAAGALIGLQFVVMTLISNLPISQGNAQAGDVFSTPTVAHFAVVLMVSAAASAPWGGITVVAALWGVVGVSGIVYVTIVARRMRSQTAYQAVFEDWLFHVLSPLLSYTTLAASACVAFGNPRTALFLVAAASLLLLFTGIHNAWDIIRYHVFMKTHEQQETERKQD
jgi:hypothetical protein